MRIVKTSRMARKRNSTKQSNENQTTYCPKQDKCVSEINDRSKHIVSQQCISHKLLVLLTTSSLILTASVLYIVYPELTHFSGHISKGLPKLRHIIDPGEQGDLEGQKNAILGGAQAFEIDHDNVHLSSDRLRNSDLHAMGTIHLNGSSDTVIDLSVLETVTLTLPKTETKEKKFGYRTGVDADVVRIKDEIPEDTIHTIPIKETKEQSPGDTDSLKRGKNKHVSPPSTIEAGSFKTSNLENPNDKKSGPIVLNQENTEFKMKMKPINVEKKKRLDAPAGKHSKTKLPKEKMEPKSKQTKDEKQKKTASTKSSKTKKSNDNRSSHDSFKTSYQRTFTSKKIFFAGRRIAPMELLHQKQSNSSVKVYLFDDFLSEQECDGLIKAHNSHTRASSVKPPLLCFDSINTLRKHIKDVGKKTKVTPTVFTPGTMCLNSSFSLKLQTWLNSNWSYSTAFYPGESRFSSNIAWRMEQAMGLRPENGGKFQITSYPIGKAYNTHTDCTLNSLEKRDRVVSVLMYLNDAEDGGETKFPDLGIWVTPKKGRAIVWNNMSPSGLCEQQSRHAASLVRQGKKYILIRWYYYKSFPGLGKRLTPPSLPTRDGDQAMVSCDDYDNGSCRWYDEWTYEHLIDYQRNKANFT